MQPGLREKRIDGLRIKIPTSFDPKSADQSIEKLFKFTKSLKLFIVRTDDTNFSGSFELFVMNAIDNIKKYSDPPVEMSYIISCPLFAKVFFLPSWEYFARKCLTRIAGNIPYAFFKLVSLPQVIPLMLFKDITINNVRTLEDGIAPIVIQQNNHQNTNVRGRGGATSNQY